MALIRRCIIRDMRFVLQQELPRMVRATESDGHAHWLSRTMDLSDPANYVLQDLICRRGV